MLDYTKIKEKVSCLDILNHLNIQVKNNRCKAIWRGGENDTSISIARDNQTWYDHSAGQGGDIFSLVSIAILNKTIDSQYVFESAVWVNNKFNIIQIQREESSAIIKLKEAGYTLQKEYKYTDDKGITKHIVERWEHLDKRKTFLQKQANGNRTMKNVTTYPYKLKDWINEDYVVIVEGEKDVETLISIGLKATTNASGAGNWNNSYNKNFKNKKVYIIEDNDNAGQQRTCRLKIELKNIAQELFLIQFKDGKKGFDVTDYFNKFGESKTKALINNATAINMANIDDSDIKKRKLIAKEANKLELRNYIIKFNKDDKAEFIPRRAVDIYNDVKKRFLDFPNKLGTTLFDVDQQTKQVIELRNESQLFAWMMDKSNQIIDWKAGSQYINKKEFFNFMQQKTKTYEQVIYAPTFPTHKSNFNGYPELPDPDPDHKYFNHWIDFFNPADYLNKILLKVLFASPLYYEPEEKRPLWILDSVDGAGVGKTTVAEQVALLYNTKPLITNKQELQRNFDELTKKLLSTVGRSARVVLIDNVIGKFDCDRLSDLITQSFISGKRAYGHGEETRPNNITYIITANSATIGNDISTRSIPIHFKAPKGGYNATWLKKLIEYRNEYRYHIFADMLDIIKNNKPFNLQKSFLRFPRFEEIILQPFCGDVSEYYDIIKMIQVQKDENNMDKDNAFEFEDRIKAGLKENDMNENEFCFISNKVLKIWYKEIFDGHSYPVQAISNWYKQNFFMNIKTLPNIRMEQRRGILWNTSNVSIVSKSLFEINNKNNINF